MKNYSNYDPRKVVITVDKNVTLARIFDDNNKVVSKGVAMCSPEDTFDFKIGSELALTRAFEAMKPKKVEWVVVDRKPRVGDYIRVTCKCYPFNDYGEVLKVSDVSDTGYVSIKITDHPKCKQHWDNFGGWLFDTWVYNQSEYEVVEPAPKKPEFRKIFRIPKCGDYVKIIRSDYSFDAGSKNEMLKISRVIDNGANAIGVDVLHNDHPRAVRMYGRDYPDSWHYNCWRSKLEFYEKV